MSPSIEEQVPGTAVWQSQPLGAPSMSLPYIKHLATRLNADVRRELLIAYAGVALSAAATLFVVLRPPNPTHVALLLFVQSGALCLLLAAILLVFQVRGRARIVLTQQFAQPSDGLAAYRSALESHRDYCFGAWRWSLPLVVPAALIVLAGEALYDDRPDKWVRLCMMVSWLLLGSIASWFIYWRKGKDLQSELDSLVSTDFQRS